MERLHLFIERMYPYICGAAVYAVLRKYGTQILLSENLGETLNGIITVDSIIIGFLGAIMPVILSMKNESKFVKYVFEKDENNLFSKYLKETIFWGLISAASSICIHVRDCMGDVVGSIFFAIAVFSFVSFMCATYRSMSHMITMLFKKDKNNDKPNHRNKSEREIELEKIYK